MSDLFKAPAVQAFGGCLGIIQCDIRSDIHQVPLRSLG